MRGRGLKQFQNHLFEMMGLVALHAGAWIETIFLALSNIALVVALHAGAWIETKIASGAVTEAASPSMRGRGLKLLLLLCYQRISLVALHAGAWIETRRNKLLC